LDEVVQVGGGNKKLFSIWKINAKKGKMNCANCSIAVDYTLAGKPTSALPWTYIKKMKNGKLVNSISYKEGTHISILEKEFGNKFIKNMTPNKIETVLKPGQRGIIFGVKKGRNVGHFFNVTNENGVLKYLDGQRGRSATLNYDYYELLPTNF
jgi:hypothetical protein